MSIQQWQDGKFDETFDVAIVVGRFQPFHNGHMALIKKAIEISRHVIVLVGSANNPRDIKNPFSYEERVEMIKQSIWEVYGKKPPKAPFYGVDYHPLTDYLYSDADWVSQVQGIVDEATDSETDARVAIVGHKKDDTSYYLDMFPQFQFVNVKPLEMLHSTDIREMYFGKGLVANCMPKAVTTFLDGFKTTKTNKDLVEEYLDNVEYQKPYLNLPFKPTFVTVDAVVICGGHVLMVKRRFTPGKGLWALPGGFLNQGERLLDGAIRELKEETRIKVSEDLLRASIKAEKVFDAPNRSRRGRVITSAYLIQLQLTSLPKVRGTDDAERAKWIPINKFLANQQIVFDDHYSIVQYFLNRAA